MSSSHDRFHWRGAIAVFLATQVVYLLTLTVSCPFWDSGEYIATSYILGVPHPPGTPLYVLIGRIAAMIPLFEMVATRVNWLSALASSVCASFLYLSTVEIYARWVQPTRGSMREESETADDTSSRWVAFFAGAVAAGFTAFGRTFWDNAIEAEVYALSSAITAAAFWLILRWARPGDRGSRTGMFVLLYYLACMSMGIHLGTFLVLPGIVLFALIVDRRIFGESVTSALFVAGLAILLHPGLLPTLGIKFWAPTFGGVVVLSIISIFRPLHASLRPGGILTWCAIAAALGISTHFYLLIRAGLDPAINEADPSNFEALWKVLIRDQYRPANPFTERKAALGIQLTRHFWDYARDQYSLGVRPLWLGQMIPYLIGTAGLIGHALRDRKSFVLLFVTYAITSFGLVFYLNFSAQEVRPRDYFFVASFQFYAVWIGLGVALLLEQFRETVVEEGISRYRPLLFASGILTLLLPALTARHYWYVHDRTDFHVAADYARNMLVPLEQNAILFTNGDNDTFPLWYLQEVEGVRKDVRVVNLSLLNTAWYIHQVEDYEPRVRIGFTEEELTIVLDYSLYHAMAAQNYGGWTPERLRQFIRESGVAPYVRDFQVPLLTKDLAVARILEQNPDRPIYLAVTVPDAMGLDERLVMEGLVFSLRDPVAGSPDRIDLDRTIHLLTEVYRFRGILDDEGNHDSSVYKDINARRLTQNYSAALIEAADECYAANREAEAEKLTETAVAISPGSHAVRFSLGILHLRAGDYLRAGAAFAEIIRRGGGDARTFRYLGRSQELLGRLEEAERSYRQYYALSPNDPESLRDLFSFLWETQKKRPEALRVLEGWLQKHPDDRDVRGAYLAYRDSLQAALGSERRLDSETPANAGKEGP